MFFQQDPTTKVVRKGEVSETAMKLFLLDLGPPGLDLEPAHSEYVCFLPLRESCRHLRTRECSSPPRPYSGRPALNTQPVEASSYKYAFVSSEKSCSLLQSSSTNTSTRRRWQGRQWHQSELKALSMRGQQCLRDPISRPLQFVEEL